MQSVDLLSLLPEPDLPVSSKFDLPSSFYGKNQTCYYGALLRKKSGINSALLQTVPDGSLIVDLGGGIDDPWDRNELESKNLQLLAVNHDANLLNRERETVDTMLAYDLRNIPQSFANGRKMRDNLARLLKLPHLSQAHDQINLLLSNLDGHEIGMVIFGQILRYLPKATVNLLLNIALEQVRLLGRIDIFEIAPYQQHGLRGRTDGFHEAATLAQRHGDFNEPVLEFLLPSMEHALYENLVQESMMRHQETGGKFSHDLFMIEVLQRLENGVAIESHPLESAYLADANAFDNDRVRLYGAGIMHIGLQKK